MFRDSNLKDELLINVLRLPLVMAFLASFVFVSDFRGYGAWFGQNALTAVTAVVMIALTVVTFPRCLQLQKKLSRRNKPNKTMRIVRCIRRGIAKREARFS
ncbi:hypothetical protein IC617_05480 [Neiella sp. HB171785]|uniref:Uncharacterized protein n=1 Tax=Neiella litorisoli TaxID=2771431 RepID=A0A8J6QI05_9GAMM|nr:hypothetical protein [Neiella litorisoli]MBD1388872.1 hypothetical protein [Neiella litorisoli]